MQMCPFCDCVYDESEGRCPNCYPEDYGYDEDGSYASDDYEEPRFPDVDWYCDNCNAYLNDQDDFDDHLSTWECEECGYENTISSDSILTDNIITSIVSLFKKR